MPHCEGLDAVLDDTPFPLSPLAFGSVVAKVVFPGGYVKCDTTTSCCSPALFRLLCFLRKVPLFSEEVPRLVLSSGGDPSLNVKMP